MVLKPAILLWGYTDKEFFANSKICEKLGIECVNITNKKLVIIRVHCVSGCLNKRVYGNCI